MKIKDLMESDSLGSIKVFDNGGRTPDRYTVYFPSADYHLTMSEYPSNPGGIINKQGGRPQQNEKLGKETNINQVSSGAKQRIMKELEGNQRASLL